MSRPSKSKHWTRWNVSVSSALSKSAAYGPPCTHRCRCCAERPRQHVGEREQPPLRRVERVDVLDRLVQIAVVLHGEPILAARLQQHPHERQQEVQVLRRSGSRQNGLIVKARCASPMRHTLPPSSGVQLLVAAAEIEDDGDGVVLLRVREDEVQEKRLAAARGARGPARGPTSSWCRFQKYGVWCSVSKTARHSRPPRWGSCAGPCAA